MKMKSYTLELKAKVILYYRSLQSKVDPKDKSINQIADELEEEFMEDDRISSNQQVLSLSR